MNQSIMTKARLFSSIACALILCGCSATGHSTQSTAPSAPSKNIPTANIKADMSSPKSIKSSIEGEWLIVMVDNVTIHEDEEQPYIYFEGDKNRFYASNGCNILNGTFEINDQNRLVFSQVLSTMRACPDNAYGFKITSMLSDGTIAGANIKTVGADTELILTSPNSSTHTMRLVRPNSAFLNGQWRIATVNGQNIEDDEATIFIDLNEKKIHGNTGCNYFNGMLTIDPASANSISFSNMAVTRMLCQKHDQENAILVGLEEVTKCIQGKHNTAMLMDKSGKKVITLERIE